MRPQTRRREQNRLALFSSFLFSKLLYVYLDTTTRELVLPCKYINILLK